ncbi:MAG: FHA domain-containing protein, partial [Planctomycetes bacterium]|nr:FHA domain-containing protein [Planctomycetota bacterium]
MPPFLVRLEDGAGGEALPLARERATVGRSSDNEIVLADARVSSRHALIFREGTTWWIEDLKSTNGTTIGEERIARAPLAHGAIVGFGGVRLRFLLPGLPEPPPPPRKSAPAPEPAAPAEHRAVLTAVTLAALAAVFFGGYGVAQHLFVGGGVEAPAPGNLVGPHFSFEEGSKAPLGWNALPGTVLARVPGGLPPGRFAARVCAEEERPGAAAIVECAEACAVVPSSAYTLQGVCTHEGGGASGLGVAWLEGEVVVEVSYGDLCESGERLVAADTFTCPPRCEQARVLLIGFGGTATFDRIELTKNDAPEEAGLSAAAGEFALRMDRTGTFDLHLGKERVLGAVRLHFGGGVRGFKELPGQRLGFGSLRGEGEGASSAGIARSVFVPETGAWVTVQTRSTLTEEGGTITWRFPRNAGLEKARVAIVFKLPEDPLDGGKRFTVHGPGGRRAAALSELSGVSAGEIAIGNLTFQGSAARRHRLCVAFPGVGTLLAQGSELAFHVEKELELKLAQEMYELALSWSFESAYEEREVDESIAEARKLARQGKEGRAIVRLQEAAALAGSTPGAAARVAAAQ